MSYAYTDPTGNQVQLLYRDRAKTKQRHMTYSSPDEMQGTWGNPPQTDPNLLQLQAPSPVQDTPEVQAAKAQFFEAYNRQLQFIQQLRAQQAGVSDTTQESEVQQDQNASASEQGDASKTENTTTTVSSQDEKGQNVNAEETTTVKSDKEEIPSSTEGPAENKTQDSDMTDQSPSNSTTTEEATSTTTPPPPEDVKENATTTTAPINKGSPDASYSISVSVGGGSGQVGAKSGGWQYQYQIPAAQPQQPQPFTVGYEQQPYSSGPVSSPVNPGYQLSYTVGASQNSAPSWGQQEQQQGQRRFGGFGTNMNPPASNSWDTSTMASSNNPGYFYYVSVGGSPPNPPTQNGGSNNLLRSNYPTSLRTQLSGGVPPDARHDAQVPRRRNNVGRVQNDVGTRSNTPAYMDMDPNQVSQGKPYTILGFIPGALVSLQDESGSTTTNGNRGTATVQIGNDKQRVSFPILVLKQK